MRVKNICFECFNILTTTKRDIEACEDMPKERERERERDAMMVEGRQCYRNNIMKLYHHFII